MENSPLVSIVTVTLNCAELIQATIDSVAAQKYPFIEHIIVDGQSDDGTLDILKQNRNRNLRWISEPDSGVYDAMNKGLSLASSESIFINFLNAGDILHDDEVIGDVVSGGKDTEVNIYGNIQKGAQSVASPERINRFVLSTDMVCHQAIFFNTRLHRKFVYDDAFRICADYKLLLEMLYASKKFKKVNRTVINFDVSGLSSVQRVNLYNEKQKIRKAFPRVWAYHQIRSGFRRLRNSLTS